MLLGDPKWGADLVTCELRPIYQDCRVLTFALARLSSYIYLIYSSFATVGT